MKLYGLPENAFTGQIFEENEARFFISKPLLKMNFFIILARTLPIFLRVFPNFTVSAEGYLEYPPHIKLEFCLTLVNG